MLHRCNTITVVLHMTLEAFLNPRVAFPALETGVVCSGRADFREVMHSRQVFVRGESPFAASV